MMRPVSSKSLTEPFFPFAPVLTKAYSPLSAFKLPSGVL